MSHCAIVIELREQHTAAAAQNISSPRGML